MTGIGIARLALFGLAYPICAFLTVYAAMGAGWSAASWGGNLPPGMAVPLMVAVAGGVTSLPLALLGHWATGDSRLALIPTGLTVVLVLALALTGTAPALAPLRFGQSTITLLMIFALVFLALAAAIYALGIWRLCLALRRAGP